MPLNQKDDVCSSTRDDKGRTGKILRFVGDDKVVIEGVNVVWKHLKPTQQASPRVAASAARLTIFPRCSP